MLTPRYRNLVIVGNGFDCWQGLPTSYTQFRTYYVEHIDEALRALRIPKESIPTPDGGKALITPVELVYGNPFAPGALPSDFFYRFECSLNRIDDQQLNLFFGRKNRDIQNLAGTVAQAQAILRRLFSQWILSLNISQQAPAVRLRQDCFFINFNYTDTLQKRFGVNPEHIFHIHGDAAHPDTILFGHAAHPELPLDELKAQKFLKPIPGTGSRGLPRLKGLYAIENALYHTDKHVADRIDLLCRAFLEADLCIEDIEHIYVLGHSFGEPDFEYFQYLDQVTRCGCNFNAISAFGRMDKSLLYLMALDKPEAEPLIHSWILDQLHLNVLYASHHRERVLGKAPLPFPKQEAMERALLGREISYDRHTADSAAQAVQQRFLWEQAGRTQKVLTQIAQERGLSQLPEECRSVLGLADYLDGGHEPRKRNAQWHISYFTPEDKQRIEKTMKRLGLKRYTLYHGIAPCLEGCTVKP